MVRTGLIKPATARTSSRLALLALLIAGGLAAQGRAPSPAATSTAFAAFQHAAPSLYIVRTFGLDRRVLQSGNGVAIGATEVITNFHLVDGAATIELRQGDHVWAARLDGCAVARDLCRLEVAGLDAHPAVLAGSSLPRAGQPVYAMNASLGKAPEMSTGAVASIIYTGGEPLIESSATVHSGKSGGGLFDVEGRLLGITEMPVLDRQSESYAIPIAAFSELPQVSARGIAPAGSPPSAAPPAAAVAPPTPTVPLTFAGVRRVCITVTGTSPSADTASALLASELTSSHTVAVSDSCLQVDAILKGAVQAPGVAQTAAIELRLVVAGGGVIWGDAEHSSGSLFDDALHDVVRRCLRRFAADLDRARSVASTSRQ